MRKLIFIFVAIFALCSCSKDDGEILIKSIENVTTEDLYGDWSITYPISLSGAKFEFHKFERCTWSDKFGNFFEGPYNFIENLNDDVLKQQGLLLGIDNLNKIHINTFKVRSFNDNHKELLLICDLQTFLAHPDYAKHNWNEIDRNTYYFWDDNYFDYQFEIINYNDTYMELKLLAHSVRFGSYIEKYPLMLEKNTILKLQRISK